MELRVDILEGRNLAPKDPNNFSDPYVLIEAANPKGLFVKSPLRSETRYFSLNPTWEKASFSLDPNVKKIRVEIWDEDKDKEDDFLGFAIIDVNFDSNKTEELWVKLNPRDDKEVVSGDIHVVISKGLSTKVHPSILFNQRQRMVRVFLSSTFTDMFEDREVIMRKVMIELSKFCYERGVILTYIDMRWGITEEMADQTILRCLQEVDNSRPYFVATIGQRYGWHQDPTDIPDKVLISNFEKADPESVTELEIQHGFLLNPALPKGHSFFYFRHPDYSNSKPDKPRFVDTKPYAIENLNKLKETITKKANEGQCVLRDYSKPVDLEAMLLKDLKAAIERDYPKVQESENLAHKYFHDHENFARSMSHGYVPREEYYKQLNKVIEGKGGQYLVVVGESGSGKSALLANWWQEQRNKTKTKTNFFAHFIGTSTLASSFHGMIIRLYETINNNLTSYERLPVPREDKLLEEFHKFLNVASVRGGLTIIFDGVNQLSEDLHDLHWLPATLPLGVNIIISSFPGKIVDAAKARHWNQLQVTPLSTDEVKKLINERLSLYGKRVTDAHMARVVGHKLSTNPLFVSTVLSELFIIGVHRQLPAQLDRILGSSNIEDLFQQVLLRWEENFGVDLTRDVLQLIAGSRQGLLEATAQNITAAAPITLFPLLSAMRNFLVIINQGKLTFSHDYLRRAVAKRASKLEAQKKLVAYWESCPFDYRTAYELPWILAELVLSPENKNSGDTQQALANILLDLQRFKVLFSKGDFQMDLFKYWRTLSKVDSKKWNMGSLYVAKAGSATTSQAQVILDLSRFLLQASLLQDALTVGEKALALFEKDGRKPDIAESLNNLGDILREKGQLAEASDKMKQAYAIRIQSFGDFHPTVAQSHSSLGQLYHLQDKFADALVSFNKALEILNKGKNQREIAKTLHNIAAVYHSQDKVDDAIIASKQALEKLISLLGDKHPDVATAFSSLAILYHEKGDIAKAKDYHKQALDLRIQLFGDQHLDVAQSLHNLGVFFAETDDVQQAMVTLESAVTLQTSLLGPNHPHVAASVTSLADVCYNANNLDNAVKYGKQALKILVNDGKDKNNEEAKHLLGMIAGGLTKLGKAEEARRFNASSFNSNDFKAGKF